jgi:hypothetical protein
VLLQLLLRRLPGDAADEELALVRLHLRLLAPLPGFASARVREGDDGGERERGELGISAPGVDLGGGRGGFGDILGRLRAGLGALDESVGVGFLLSFSLGIWFGVLFFFYGPNCEVWT